jgi:high affinity sulfate transporter 1
MEDPMSSEQRAARGLEQYVPLLGELRTYDRSWLSVDAIAGLTLWGLLAPEAMAYAGVAGLPPQAGLYTLVASLAIYALLGTSRQLSVQPTSATAALLASSLVVAGVATSDPQALLANATAMVLVVGVVFLAAGILRLGFITQFISEPVMAGFVTGLAVFIAAGQLNKLFGVEKGEGNAVEKLLAVVRELPDANVATTIVGLAALALLFVLPRLSRRLPAGLIVLFGSIVVSGALDLAGSYGVDVAGTLPQGLPVPSLPDVPLATYLDFVLPALGIFFVAYSEALGVAREFADKHGYRVDPDQELRAQGVANIASGLLGGMVAAGSMSGSAVNDGAGARSRVALLVAWLAILVTVLFLTPLFATLPEAVLAALIIHAVWHLIVARKLQRFRAISRTEWTLGVITFLGVILVDVLQGMVIGVVLALVLLAYRSSRPHVAVLGRLPGVARAFVDVGRHPTSEPIEGLLVLRIDSPLYFANAQSVADRVRDLIDAADSPVGAVVVDADTQDEIDVTAADAVAAIAGDLAARGIPLFFGALHDPVRRFLRDNHFVELPPEQDLPTLDAAVRAAEARLAAEPADARPSPDRA